MMYTPVGANDLSGHDVDAVPDAMWRPILLDHRGKQPAFAACNWLIGVLPQNYELRK